MPDDQTLKSRQDAPAPKPKEPYRFENGEEYVPTTSSPPFVPDNGFDGDSIYGLLCATDAWKH
jgi:hypothetical protein